MHTGKGRELSREKTERGSKKEPQCRSPTERHSGEDQRAKRREGVQISHWLGSHCSWPLASYGVHTCVEFTPRPRWYAKRPRSLPTRRPACHVPSKTIQRQQTGWMETRGFAARQSHPLEQPRNASCWRGTWGLTAGASSPRRRGQASPWSG